MKKYSYEFKAQAVEKALNRGSDVSFNSVAYSCGVDHSTLRRWVKQFENQSYGEGTMNEEKSPRLWTAEQKLEIVMACESMDKEQISAHCREHGVYPHHVKQSKAEFLKLMTTPPRAANPAQVKQLREENKSLRKELRRKEKALAEAAALLVLKKKPRGCGEHTRTIDRGI